MRWLVGPGWPKVSQGTRSGPNQEGVVGALARAMGGPGVLCMGLLSDGSKLSQMKIVHRYSAMEPIW